MQLDKKYFISKAHGRKKEHCTLYDSDWLIIFMLFGNCDKQNYTYI